MPILIGHRCFQKFKAAARAIAKKKRISMKRASAYVAVVERRQRGSKHLRTACGPNRTRGAMTWTAHTPPSKRRKAVRKPVRKAVRRVCRRWGKSHGRRVCRKYGTTTRPKKAKVYKVRAGRGLPKHLIQYENLVDRISRAVRKSRKSRKRGRR